MKHATLKLGKILIIALSSSLLSQTAWAGFTTPYEVGVSSSAASGSKKAARYSQDYTQYIGCNVGVNSSASGDYMSCYARNKAGSYFYCYSFGSSAANFISALETATENSYLSMSKYSNGTCAYLRIENSSKFL